MTKILYITEGKYLEFPKDDCFTQTKTIEFEKSIYNKYMKIEIFVETLKRMSRRDYFVYEYYKCNINIPITDNELEIIYD